MPFRDGTVPLGAGPQSGRGAGWCGGTQAAGNINPGRRQGVGGRGWRWRNLFRTTGLTGWERAAGWPGSAQGAAPEKPAEEPEVQVLKRQAESLGNTLEDIRKRIEELEAKSAS